MDDVETGRRLRAARGYAGLEAEDVARQLNFSVSTLYRTEAGTRPLHESEKRIVADLCDLPIGFFSIDFAGDLEDEVDLRVRLRNAETQLASLVGLAERFNTLEQELREVRSQTEELTREALERRLREAAERESTRRDRSSGTLGAEDAR